MAARRHELLLERQHLTGGDAELELDEVDAGDRLGHRVFDLETGVDLEEVDRFDTAGLVDEELDRARTLVADRAGQRNRTVADRRHASRA